MTFSCANKVRFASATQGFASGFKILSALVGRNMKLIKMARNHLGRVLWERPVPMPVIAAIFTVTAV